MQRLSQTLTNAPKNSLFSLGAILLLVAMLAAFLLDTTAVASLAQSSQSPLPQPVTAGLSASEFGLAFINSAESQSSPQRIQRGASTGAQMDRFPLYWDRIETGYGQFDWSAQDAALQANAAQGLDTLAILLGTPGHYWNGVRAAGEVPSLTIGGSFTRQQPGQMQARAQAGCSSSEGPPPPSGLWNPVFSDGSDEPGPGKSINPDNPWARYVSLAVGRYMPGGPAGTNVRHWEIWNEPDLCHFWSGSPQEYARLLKVAYLAAKFTDSNAYIVFGGLAHFANGQWLYDFLDALRADPLADRYNGFFDAAGSHHYSLSYLGYQYTQKVRDAMAARGWGQKPIWITESGVPVCGDYPGPGCPSPWRATPVEQASYIWQNIAYTRLAGGGPIFHFMLHDDCGNVVQVNSPDGFGIVKNESSSYCSPANAEPRLAHSAFVLANRYFPGTELAWADIQDGRARRVAFYHPATQERRLLTWSVKPEAAVARIPATGPSARLIRLDGSESVITPVNGFYEIHLPGATNRNWPNDSGGYDMGIFGEPFLLIERDELPPVAAIDGLPVYSPASIPVRWRVDDWGAGLEQVSVWVQIDDSPWQLWLENVNAHDSAVFAGEPGRRYRFSVQAQDRLGYRLEGWPVLAETTVAEDSQVTGQVIDPAGGGVVGVEVRVGQVTAVTGAGGNFSMRVPIGNWDIFVNGQLIHRGRAFGGADQLSLLFAPGHNPVMNGNFESELAGWQIGGSSPVGVEQQPGTSDNALRLAQTFVPNPGVPGAEGSDGGNSTVVQRVRLPQGRPFLAFAYRVESGESGPGHDKFEVIAAADGQPADYLLVQHQASGWQYRSVDLSRYAGQEITLIFNVYETSPHRRTSALLDVVTISDVSVQDEGSNPPPVPTPAPPAPEPAMPLNQQIFLPAVTR